VVPEYSAEADIWAKEVQGNRVVQQLHNEELNDLYF
jgi:hypothetical protein